MNRSKTILVAIILTLQANGAFAALPTKPVLTIAAAKTMAAAAAAEARKNNTGAAIAIVDDGGLLIYLERLDGTFAAGSSVSTGKARTSATFKKPTRVFEEAIKNGRVALTGVSEMTPLQGGVPVIVEGQVIGAVGVSGASSAQQDEEYAMIAANAIKDASAQGVDAKNSSSTASRPVAVFAKQDVEQGFAKGAVLYNVGDYQVHTSRRDAPGKAEVHTLDTDIFHVLEGEATLVTGGTLVEPQTVEAHEIRGASIQGGQTRRIVKGDVVVIPQGTPHWFKEIRGPVLYMAVKVRAAGEVR